MSTHPATAPRDVDAGVGGGVGVGADAGVHPERIERPVAVPLDHPAFAGHFPGRPILPGVSLLAEVLEAVRDDPDLRAQVGEAPRLSVVKFIAPVLPGAALVVGLTRGRAGLDFEVRDGERLAASGRIAFGATAGAP